MKILRHRGMFYEYAQPSLKEETVDTIELDRLSLKSIYNITA